MAKAGVQWRGNPSAIAGNLNGRKRRIKAGVLALAESHAARGESAMKAGAPWDDRTSNARQGLFGEVTQEGDTTVIQLGGTMEYQPYLELGTSRAASRPIIMPTAEVTAREISADIQQLIKRFGG